ncbi:MAG: lipopolysaccharide biosynthesis protein [Gammaproteobacteria bacterium]|nr:lipopolysaccharide biosynthesis protein [Gammaproteobacteria bacterium]
MSYYTSDNARRSIWHTAVFRFASQASTLASYVVLVRAMSEHDFGVFNLLYAIIPVVSTIASLGIEQTLRRFEPVYLRAGEPRLAHKLVRIASRLRFATNLVFLLAIFALWSWLGPVFRIGPYRAEFVLFSVILLLHFQTGVLAISLSSHMLHRYSIGMTVVLSVAKLLAYSALYSTGQLTLMTAIGADCVAYGLMYAGLGIAHRRHCRPLEVALDETHAVLPEDDRRRIVRYGLFNNFNDSGTLFLSSHADNFFVAAFLSPAAVGAYAFYSRINEMAEQLLPTRQFSSVMLPMIFAVKPDEAPDKLPRYFTFLVNVSLCVHLPILAFFAVYHRELVEFVFAGKFAQHSALLPVITAFAVFGAVSESATIVAQYHERAGIILLSKVFAVANVIGLMVMVPLAGIQGAAISTGTSIALKNVFIWWHVRRSARWRNWRPALVSAALVWGSFWVVGTGLKDLVAGPALLQLIIGALLCAAWALVFLRTAALSLADREMVGRLVSGRVADLARLLGVVPRTSGA